MNQDRHTDEIYQPVQTQNNRKCDKNNLKLADADQYPFKPTKPEQRSRISFLEVPSSKT